MGRLSSNSVVLVADHSGHEIHLDQPELVLAAVEQLRLAIATHAKVRAPTVGASVLPASPGR
jgi:phage gp45-like